MATPWRELLEASCLEGKQPIEEGAIAFEALAQLFGGDVVAAVPLLFKLAALLCELLRDVLDHGGNQRVGLLHGVARLVDERRLHLVPAGAEVAQLVFGEERAFVPAVGLRARSRVSRCGGFACKRRRRRLLRGVASDAGWRGRRWHSVYVVCAGYGFHARVHDLSVIGI